MEKFLVITAKATNENICICWDMTEQGIADKINYAREYDERGLRGLERNKENYPNMNNFWDEQITKTKARLAGGYEALTVEDHVAREKSRLVTGKVKEITEDEFNYALDCLPPIKWYQNERYSMFCIREMWTFSFTNQYIYDKVHDKYYTTMVDIKDESTWLDKLLGL